MTQLKGYRAIKVSRTTERRLITLRNRIIKDNPEKYEEDEPSLHQVIIWILDELQKNRKEEHETKIR